MSAEQKSDTDQQQFWRMAIETWKSSGLSIRQFCANEKLTEASFYAWRKKLTGSDLIVEEQDNDKHSESEFIEVTIPQNNPVAIEFVLTSGNVLKIPAGVDTKTLTTVLSVLHQTISCKKIRSADICLYFSARPVINAKYFSGTERDLSFGTSSCRKAHLKSFLVRKTNHLSKLTLQNSLGYLKA